MIKLLLMLGIICMPMVTHAQSVRLYTPDQSAVVGDTVSVYLYATPPSWADTLQGVHVAVLDYNHSYLTFVGVTNYTPWNSPYNAGPIGAVNSGCGDPDELTNDPYVHISAHDGFGGGGGTVVIVIGGCAVEMPSDWDPWNTYGNEVMVSRSRFVVTQAGQTSVAFAECSHPQYRNYLTWIEWNSDCNTNEWQSDIVGAHLLNDPPTITTNGSVDFSITTDTPSDVMDPVYDATWTVTKELYK